MKQGLTETRFPPASNDTVARPRWAQQGVPVPDLSPKERRVQGSVPLRKDVDRRVGI